MSFIKTGLFSHLTGPCLVSSMLPNCIFHCTYFSAILDSSHGEKLENCEVLKPFKVTRQTMKFGMSIFVTAYCLLICGLGLAA